MSLKIQCDVHRHSFEHRWTDHSKLLKSLFARGEDDKGKTSSSLCRLSVPSGGADRDRTGDPLLAKQVLSQLSYSPVFACLFSAWLRCSDSLAQSRTQVRSFTRSPPRLARRKTSCAKTRACLFSAWLRCSDSLAQSRTQVRSFTRSPPRLARRKTSCAKTRACLFSAWLRCSDSLAQSRTQV